MSIKTPSPSIFRPAGGVDKRVVESSKELIAEIDRPQDPARRDEPRRADEC